MEGKSCFFLMGPGNLTQTPWKSPRTRQKREDPGETSLKDTCWGPGFPAHSDLDLS